MCLFVKIQLLLPRSLCVLRATRIPNYEKHCNENRFVVLRKHCFRPDLCPGPFWAANDAPPDPVVGWGERYSLPIFHPSKPLASRFRRLRPLTGGPCLE